MKLLDRLRGRQETAERTRDPVCGMWVDPAAAAARSEHRGRAVHFCAPACKRAFDQDPERFAGRLGDA